MRQITNALARGVILCGLVVTIGFAACKSYGAEVIPIAGKAIQKTEKMDVLYTDAVTGRLIYILSNRGMDQETTGSGLFQGSARTNRATWDLVNGVGTGQGISRVETAAGDAYVAEFNGVCMPILTDDGKSVPRCYGGWVLLPGSGTGHFVNVQAGGSWTGTVQANGDFEVVWSGHLQHQSPK